MQLGLYLTSYTKMDSKWIKDQNMKGKTVRLIKENIGEHFCDLVVGKDLTKTLKNTNCKTKKYVAMISAHSSTIYHK